MWKFHKNIQYLMLNIFLFDQIWVTNLFLTVVCETKFVFQLPLIMISAAATPVQNGQNALSGTLLDQWKTCDIKVGQDFTLFLSVVVPKR